MRRHAVIVGGSAGAGRAIVQIFKLNRYSVSAVSRRVPERPVAGVFYQQSDIRSYQAVRTAFRSIVRRNGKIDCVVFCQRFRGKGDAWRGEIETGLFGTKNVVDVLIHDFNLEFCSIVAISSVNSRAITRRATVGYHVAKAGLNAMIRAYALEWRARDIRFNTVSPGTFIKDEARSFFEKDKIAQLRARVAPLGRLPSVDQVAQAAFFLCAGQSSAITGQNIVLDSGLSLTRHEYILHNWSKTKIE